MIATGTRLRRLAWSYATALLVLVVAADRGWLDVSWLAGLPAADKAGHFLLIGLLSYVVNLARGGARLRRGRLTVLEGSLLVAAFVAVEEISQLWLVHRSFDLADLSADLAGIWIFGRLARRHLRAPPRGGDAARLRAASWRQPASRHGSG